MMRCIRIASPRAATALLAAGVILVGSESAPAVEIGDSRDSVLEELGRPHSTISIGEREVLHYERGRVALEVGAVSEADLLSPEDHEERVRRMEEREAARRERERAEQKRRLQQGLTLRNEAVNDPRLAVASAESRVHFWQDFARRYPEIPLGAHYDRALQELQVERTGGGTPTARAERAVVRVEERVAQAEARVADVEARALHAWERTLKTEAERLEREREEIKEKMTEADRVAYGGVVYPYGFVTSSRPYYGHGSRRPEPNPLPTTVKYPGRPPTPGKVLGFSHMEHNVPSYRAIPLSAYPRISYD